jgi:Leucine-rich repeat (LRR) protein
LSALSELWLRSNQISSIEASSFSNWTKLEVINLGDNYLFRLDRDLFEKLIHLKELHLDRNMFLHLDPSIFRKQIHLRTLDLSFNKFMSLDPCLFKNLAWLDDLNVASNFLQVLLKDNFLSNQIRLLNLSSNLLASLNALDLSFNDLAVEDLIYKGLILFTHVARWVVGTHLYPLILLV